MRRLVIRPGAIGDCILSLPAIEALEADYLEVWIASQNMPLIRFADRVRSIASTGLDLLGIPDVSPPARLIEDLRGFDSIFSWYGENRTEFREAVERLGLPFTFRKALPDEMGRIHAADFFLSQVCPALAGAVPRIACPRAKAGFMAIHPFSGSPRKTWPLDRFLAVASELERHIPMYWCIPPDGMLQEVPAERVVRFEDLYELCCWLAGASLYLGNDSGITHLAAAVGTPVVAVFGPTSPLVWAPRAIRQEIVAPPSPGPVAEIAVESVAAACFRVLG